MLTIKLPMTTRLADSRFWDDNAFITGIARKIDSCAKNEKDCFKSNNIVQHNGSLLIIKEVRYSLHTIIRACLDLVPDHQKFYSKHAYSNFWKGVSVNTAYLRMTPKDFVSEALEEELLLILEDTGRFQNLESELEKYWFLVEQTGKWNSHSELDRQLTLSWI